jgi:hypothetical protein
MYRRRKHTRASQRAVDAGAVAEGDAAAEALGRRRYIMPQSSKARWALWRAIRGDSTGPEIPIVAKGSSRRVPEGGSRGFRGARGSRGSRGSPDGELAKGQCRMTGD